MTWVWLSMIDCEGLTISELCLQGDDDIPKEILDSDAMPPR